MKLTIEIVSSFLNTTFKNIQILRLTRTIQIYLIIELIFQSIYKQLIPAHDDTFCNRDFARSNEEEEKLSWNFTQQNFTLILSTPVYD